MYRNHSRRPFLAFLLIPLFILGIGLAVMLLWNALMPDIFQLPTLNFWQAVGLLVLSRLLLGGFRGGHRGWGGHRCRDGMRKKWMNMTPDERKQFMNMTREERRQFMKDRADELRAQVHSQFGKRPESQPGSEE